MTDTTGVIILAAGSSSRLGSSKQLLHVDGVSLLQRVIFAAEEVCFQNICVVLGANAEKHREVIMNPSIKIVVNNQWQRGIGSSIKAGLKSLLTANEKLASVVLLVCDQPFLTSRHVQLLLQTQQQTSKGIVASSYAGTIGVPAVFSIAYYNSLMNLPDTHGAKTIIEQNMNDTVVIDFPQGEYDIDTKEDLEKFLNRTGKS